MTSKELNEAFERWWKRHGDLRGDNKVVERRAFMAGLRLLKRLAVPVLKSVSRDCQMALNGDWDKGDDGFQATLDSVNGALKKLGVAPPKERKEGE